MVYVPSTSVIQTAYASEYITKGMYGLSDRCSAQTDKPVYEYSQRDIKRARAPAKPSSQRYLSDD